MEGFLIAFKDIAWSDKRDISDIARITDSDIDYFKETEKFPHHLS